MNTKAHFIGRDEETGERMFAVPSREMYPALRTKALFARKIARRAIRANLDDERVESALSAAGALMSAAIAARVAA